MIYPDAYLKEQKDMKQSRDQMNRATGTFKASIKITGFCQVVFFCREQ
jgi:hypothetical protein